MPHASRPTRAAGRRIAHPGPIRPDIVGRRRLTVADFTHLHLHTQYSLLDGAIRLDDLFPKLKELGMKSCAITDHGNMFGALDFYRRAKEFGVKPIFGCETYVAPGERGDKSERGRGARHLILLAKNNTGYQNLQYLISMGHLEGFYYHPRIDKQVLKDHSEGLIGLSACLGGEVAQSLQHDKFERSVEVAKEYASFFAPGDYYLEVMDNGVQEQGPVNDGLVKISRETGIPLVVTNDCHYLNRQDARAHEFLMCIQTGKTIADARRLQHSTDAYYLKSVSEIESAWHHIPEVMENAARIAAQCEVKLDLGKTYLPRYAVPEGETLETYLTRVAEEGLEKRFEELGRLERKFDPDVYRTRLALEMGVINKMGFAGYFLIVWDFINHAKSKGIPVGPGRGSGAGSLVAYALRITDIDPLPYNLLFERFLNPERVSMPDFDVDFCMNRRSEVISYVTEKYGQNQVGQIATFHQLKSKAAVRDVARVMGLPFGDADRLAKLIPEPVQGKSVKLTDALKQEPRLRAEYDKDPKVKELIDIAIALEGLCRHAGMHAAGVVIAEKPLWEYVPCFKGQNDEIVTQWTMSDVEKAGLVKFDFLGLKTLTVVDIASKLLRQEKSDFAIEAIPLDDKTVYKMIAEGDVVGVFQMESSGFRELMKKLKPDCFEDIIAAVALYRPGPLEGGMVDDFIAFKHGLKTPTYLHPWLEPVLKDTYGVIVYQEQVMQIAQVIGGYTLGGADLLRRAMGKKKAEEMAKQKATFMDGAAKKGVDAAIAQRIFELMEFFAGYGFNKSHSAAYALVSYQTAYLKCHYPHEFMAALLSSERQDIDSVVKYVAEARAMGLEVLPPDVNESQIDFSVVRYASLEAAAMATGATPVPATKKNKAKQVKAKRIRFGLGAVKNVGETALESILESRQKGGEFVSVYEFCERVDLRKCNRRVLEALIKSGACDSLTRAPQAPDAGAAAGRRPRSLSRAQLMGALDLAVERGQSLQKERESGQTSLFGLLEAAAPQGTSGAPSPERYPESADWTPKEKLAFEKETLGFYLSGHPLDRYADELERYTTARTDTLTEKVRTRVVMAGIVTEYRERPLKSGNGRIAFFFLEDLRGRTEVKVWSKSLAEHETTLKADEPILVSGQVQLDSGMGGGGQGGEGAERQEVPKLVLEEARLLSEVRKQKTSRVDFRFDLEKTVIGDLDALKELLGRHPGECSAVLHLLLPGRSETIIALDERYRVSPTDELLAAAERMFGRRVATLH
jgi:DNA polymerase-3 subunit alpha